MKTKIHFGLIALAVLGLSSCVKETTLDQANPDTPIVFDTYLGRAAQTRGAEATITTVQDNAFGVYAFYTATEDYNSSRTPDFMVNQLVKYDAGVWTYAPVKYWPNNTGDKVSFFAYSPYDSNSNGLITSVSANSFTGDPYITFAVASDVTDQIDLLYAALPNEKKPSITTKQTFNFKHALSRVAFKAQVVVDEVNSESNGTNPDDDIALGDLAPETKVTVNSITLSGKFLTKGDLNITNGKWQKTVVDGASYKLSGDDELAVKNVTKTPVQLNATDAYMMLIPDQDKAIDGIKITVDYTVETKDASLAGGKSSITNVIESDPFNFKFEQGKAYSFVLHLVLNSVKLSAEVEGWDKETAVAVNVPLNY
jgi:hypothetical protein